MSSQAESSTVELGSYFLNPEEFYTNGETTNDFLGSGSYGVVLRCLHKTHGLVAVKCSESTGKDLMPMQIEKKMNEEAKMILKSSRDNQCKNIVKLLGITKWRNSVGLVMEYMALGSLDSLIFSKLKIKELFWDVRMFLLSQLVTGVNYMHSHKPSIVHGDLKPENVLVTNQLVTKIGDFGASAMASCTGSMVTSSSMSSKASGRNFQHTIAYTPPEILKNTFARRKTATDVYAIGIILYEMITRDHAFPADALGRRNLFEESIKEGQRPDIDLVVDIAKTIDAEDQFRFLFMKDLMEVSWLGAPKKRPTLQNVLDELAKFPVSSNLKVHIQEVEKYLLPKPDCTRNLKLSMLKFPFNPSEDKSSQPNDSGIHEPTTISMSKSSSEPNKSKDDKFGDQSKSKSSFQSTNFSTETSTIDDSEDLASVLKNLAEEEDGERCLNNGNYARAAELFRGMISRTHNEQYACLLSLKLSLCLNRMGKREEGDSELCNALNKWASTLSSNQTEKNNQIDRLVRIADLYRNLGSDMRAFMIYRKAAEKYKDLESPDQRLTGLVVCISKIKKLYKDKAYIGNATSIMKQMAKWLTKVQNPHSKMVAKGLHDIANFFSHGSENELAVKYYQMAINQMDKMFGHKAQTLNLYAQCHHNMGVVYKAMSKFKEAEYFFQKSVDLYKVAEDFDSEADKDETLRQSQDSVRKLRQMLGNPTF